MNKNIVFQILDLSQQIPGWHNSKIIQELRNVRDNYDVSAIVDEISRKNNFCTVRHARLNLDEPVTVEQANKHDGGYYQAH